MKHLLVVILTVILSSCSVLPDREECVTVWYEKNNAKGLEAVDAKTIPWMSSLTLLQAIATAGGYSTPPARYIYLVRDGVRIEIDITSMERKKIPDIAMRPGDMIELRSRFCKSQLSQCFQTG